MGNGEYYNPRRLGAGETVKVGNRMAGFLCEVAGTLSVTDFGGNDLLVDFPVVEGFNRIPLTFEYPADNTVTSDTAVGAVLI